MNIGEVMASQDGLNALAGDTGWPRISKHKCADG
jgi:hypothetical protein